MSDKSPPELILDERVPSGLGGRFYGVHPALVTEVKGDPDGLGRVKVALPWSPDARGGRYEAWARVSTMMAGKNRGSWFIPDVNDEVLVAFEGGDPRRPYVLGALWNGKDPPPQSMDGAGQNNLKVLRSRAGIKITLDDSSGAVKLTLETPGQRKVVLDDGGQSIEISDGLGNSIKMQASGVTVQSSAKITLNASQVEVSAAQVSVSAGMSSFSGVVQTPTVIATSVVGSTYTPGAGNVW